MIADWRKQWGRGDFPFYYVQIAPYRYGNDRGEAAELREAQALTLSVANTGMAVTMDIGNPADIHPTNKQDVGLRLALWALAKDYGRQDARVLGAQIRERQHPGRRTAPDVLARRRAHNARRQYAQSLHPRRSRSCLPSPPRRASRVTS